MEHLWNRAGATGGDRSQMGWQRKRLKQAKKDDTYEGARSNRLERTRGCPPPGQDRLAPPIPMSPSPGSPRNRSISSTRLPEASRAFPSTADNVVENTIFGRGLHTEAHSRVS